mgnify:CR=1 FL=1
MSALRPAPIALSLGDPAGIGPELMAACEPILQAIESHTMHRFSREYGGKIGKQAIVDSGTPLTTNVIDFCRTNELCITI